jgi:hypothetical protein
MRSEKLFFLLVAGLSFFAAEMKAEQLPIRWFVKEGQEVNRPQIERLYLEATRWIEGRFGSSKRAIRPALTIRVGEPCPDLGIVGPCQDSWRGDVYIPQWDDGAPGYVVQATLTMSLLQLLSREELRDVTVSLLMHDARTFLDAPAVSRRTEKDRTEARPDTEQSGSD